MGRIKGEGDSYGLIQWIETTLDKEDYGDTLTVVLGYLDREGRLDVMVGKVDKSPDHFYLNLGSRSFQERTFDVGSTNNTLNLAFGDVDRDGRVFF